MTPKILTIAIFTYNRCSNLKQTIETLIPQLTDDVELLISDNCSTDETSAYIRGLGEVVRGVRQETNIGPDLNYIYCLENAIGKYVWTLCDDDLIKPNIVEVILDGIKKNEGINFLFLKPYGYVGKEADFQIQPAKNGWLRKDSNDLLTEVGAWITFASSAVVIKDLIDFNFVRKQVGSSLTPTALALSSIVVKDSALLSEDILVLSIEGEVNRYDVFTVFTKNYYKLLKNCEMLGYNKKLLYKSYGICMVQTIKCRIDTWKLSNTSVLNLIYYGGRHHIFYKEIVYPLFCRALRDFFGIIK